MDMQAVTTSISQVGFPIVCVIGLSFFVYRVWQKMSDQLEKTTQTLLQVNETNKTLAETGKILSNDVLKELERIRMQLEVRSNGER